MNKVRPIGLSKYLIVMKNTWDEITTYRFNFVVWRFRTILNLLVIYFLWSSVMPEHGNLFGYTKEMIITYILGTQVVSSFVFSTRTHEIADNINSGDLSVFLIRPWGYFKYWFFRDFGDKAMNVLFSAFEISLILLFLKPDIFIQTNPFFLFLTLSAIALGVVLHFFISCLLSMTGFWSPEAWAPRFIFYILRDLFSGGIFPLNILPGPVFAVVQLLPFSFLMYFPIKIYLGQIPINEIFQGFFITIAWTLLFWGLLNFIWNKGLRSYTAVGR